MAVEHADWMKLIIGAARLPLRSKPVNNGPSYLVPVAGFDFYSTPSASVTAFGRLVCRTLMDDDLRRNTATVQAMNN
jgi:hypothetical protein